MRALNDSNLRPELLELEITERLILDNSIETADILKQLDKLESACRSTISEPAIRHSAI